METEGLPHRWGEARACASRAHHDYRARPHVCCNGKLTLVSVGLAPTREGKYTVYESHDRGKQWLPLALRQTSAPFAGSCNFNALQLLVPDVEEDNEPEARALFAETDGGSGSGGSEGEGGGGDGGGGGGPGAANAGDPAGE